MAWYRAGGGGIPSSLKTGMDSVLNKKFGTSTTYPAEGWPDTVNLMGPLPEKTVSGAIATFADGADTVPLKKCEITLPASLDGYSSVDVVATGKNLFDKNAVEQHTWIIVDSTETETRNNISYLTSDYIPVKANTRYYVSTKASNRASYYDRNKNGISYFSFSGGASFNSLYDGYIRLTIKDNTDLDAFIVNEGNETIVYEPFGTTHTASLGRTIYGGSVDAVSGQGESTHGLYTFTGNEVYVQQTNQVAIKVAFTVGSSYQTGLDTAISAVEDFVAGGCGASNYLYVKTSMTAEDLKTYMANHTVLFAYVLATPETFTFDPVSIDSKLGNNTLWSEQGSDTEVTYRADINLALGGQ